MSVLDLLSCVAATISSSSMAVEWNASFIRSTLDSFCTEIIDTDSTSSGGVGVDSVLGRFLRDPSTGDLRTSFGPLSTHVGHDLTEDAIEFQSHYVKCSLMRST